MQLIAASYSGCIWINGISIHLNHNHQSLSFVAYINQAKNLFPYFERKNRNWATLSMYETLLDFCETGIFLLWLLCMTIENLMSWRIRWCCFFFNFITNVRNSLYSGALRFHRLISRLSHSIARLLQLSTDKKKLITSLIANISVFFITVLILCHEMDWWLCNLK